MGSKKVIIYLLIALSLNILKTYSQNSFTDKIEWVSKDNIKNVVYADTCQLIEVFAELNLGEYEYFFTKRIAALNKNFFCRFIDFGHGRPIWIIEIFKQEDGQWRLVAKGTVVRPHFITAEFDISKNNIVFYTIDIVYDSLTHKIKPLDKIEEIGELCITDL